jgi:hypothetical protein
MVFKKVPLYFFVFIICSSKAFSQDLKWSAFIDTSTTFSSARTTDLNKDNILDIIIGGGLDGRPESNGINAINGADGSILWSFATDEEIFGSAQLMDITGDSIDDIFIGGRYAEFYAINGSNGSQIWEFFPLSPSQAIDSGWLNFYSAQFIPDQNLDGLPDLLVANGGNHSAPAWDTLRDAGKLMVLDAMTGNILAKDTMPDGEETYCSPVVFKSDGMHHIVYGSGGENDGGALWRVTLDELMNNDISNSIMLVQDTDLGFIAPSSLADMNQDGYLDIINQAYDGTLRCIDGVKNNIIWSVITPETESSSAPTIGNFIGDSTPDVFNVLFKGAAPSFTDFYQIMIDGATGNIEFKDSLATMHYASSAAVDLDLNGRDEILISTNNHNGISFSHQLMTIDFQNNIISPFYLEEAGVNLASTPLIKDLDSNGFLDFVYAYRADSLNPMAASGFYLNCLEGNFTIPGAGIAWGSYMGTNWDGQYNYEGLNCEWLTPSVQIQEVTCNEFADGAIKVIPEGGIPPYNYLWSNGKISDTISQLDAGSYQVRVADSVGCFSNLNFDLQNPHIITFGAITPPNCPGDSNARAILNSSGCPCMFSTCTFDWASGDSSKTASNLKAGWNSVTITHMDDCIVIDSVLIPYPTPILDSLKFEDITCANDPFASSFIQLYLHDSINTTVNWNTGERIAKIDSLTEGIYYFDLLDERGCAYYDSVEINAADTLKSNYSVTDLSCFQDRSGKISASAYGGYGPYVFNWSNLKTDTIIDGLQADTYHYSVTDAVGCSFTSNEILITQPEALTLNTTYYWSDTTGNCTGGAYVKVSGGTPAYNYLWNDLFATENDTITDLCEGIYILSVTDGNGCQISDSIAILNVGLMNHLHENQRILLYPNPVINTITLDIPENIIGTDYTITDIHGKKVFEGSIKSSLMTLDISNLSMGLYYFYMDSQVRKTTKIIKL